MSLNDLSGKTSDSYSHSCNRVALTARLRAYNMPSLYSVHLDNRVLCKGCYGFLPTRWIRIYWVL